MSKIITLSRLKTALAPLMAIIDKKAERPNWSENDPTSNSYITDRPFYSKTTIVELLPETTLTFQDMGNGMYGTDTSDTFTFVANNTYIVNWNGVEYEVIGKEAAGLVTLGDSSLILGGTSTGEPFLIAGTGDMLFVYAFDVPTTLKADAETTTEVTRTVSIKWEKGYVKTMPEKYIPSTIARISDLPSSATTSNAGLMSASDKSKLDGIASGAEVNQNAFASVKVGSTTITADAKSDTLTIVAGDNIVLTPNTTSDQIIIAATVPTYPVVTQESDGLMSAEDKTTLDTLQEQATTPKDGIALKDQVNGYTYILCMRDGELVTYVGTKSIEVTTMPTTTSYVAGEIFDTTGMTVAATSYSGTIKEVDNISSSIKPLTENDKTAEVYYTEASVVHTTEVPVSVRALDPAIDLIDFEYTDNGDGTYTLTGWKGTYNGEASTEMIIPNNSAIIV